MSLRHEKSLAFCITFVICWCGQNLAYADDTRTPFLKELLKVKEGMNKEQVDYIMRPYFIGTNWPSLGSTSIELIGSKKQTYAIDTSSAKELKLKDCDVYRHSNDGEYDSDWGIVCYKDGVVTSVDFAPD